jgi:L-ascorbate metabolism protein UlaG (beta-lactamase superfamily)
MRVTNKGEFMKRSFIIIILLFAIVNLSNALTPSGMLKNIHWFGQSSVRIDAGKARIFIDPVNLPEQEKADIILVTHYHNDHYSLKDIEKLVKNETVVVSPFKIDKAGINNSLLNPGNALTIGDVRIEAVYAYNIVKTQYHRKSAEFVGYVLTIEGVKVYHAGDTERIPEMKDISCDIAMLPLGQIYTMDSVDEAVLSALDVKAKIAIPIHFGFYEGTEKDAKYFVKELKKKGIKSKILTREK